MCDFEFSDRKLQVDFENVSQDLEELREIIREEFPEDCHISLFLSGEYNEDQLETEGVSIIDPGLSRRLADLFIVYCSVIGAGRFLKNGLIYLGKVKIHKMPSSWYMIKLYHPSENSLLSPPSGSKSQGLHPEGVEICAKGCEICYFANVSNFLPVNAKKNSNWYIQNSCLYFHWENNKTLPQEFEADIVFDLDFNVKKLEVDYAGIIQRNWRIYRTNKHVKVLQLAPFEPEFEGTGFKGSISRLYVGNFDPYREPALKSNS